MKVSRQFVWIDRDVDEKASDTGWRLTDMPTFDPVSKYRMHVMVHDILEHHPDDGTDLRYEMLAFGASFYIRVFGKWRNFTKGFDDGLWTQYQDISGFLSNCNWKIEKTDEKIHPDLIKGLWYCLKHYRPAYFDNIADRELKALKRQAIKMSFRWISMGYRRAKQRWGNNPSWKICKMFESMEDTIKHLTNNTAMTHGDKMVVTFDTETLQYIVDHNIKSRNYTFGRICYKRMVNGIIEFIQNNRNQANA